MIDNDTEEDEFQTLNLQDIEDEIAESITSQDDDDDDDIDSQFYQDIDSRFNQGITDLAEYSDEEDDTIPHNYQEETSDIIDATPSLENDHDAEPFVFYTIAELNKMESSVEVNNQYVKTLAECKRIGLDGNMLIEVEMDYFCEERSRIQVNFDCVRKFPKEGDTIEAFGHLEFVCQNEKKVPIFTVWFWNKRIGDFPNYVRMCIEMREMEDE